MTEKCNLYVSQYNKKYDISIMEQPYRGIPVYVCSAVNKKNKHLGGKRQIPSTGTNALIFSSRAGMDLEEFAELKLAQRLSGRKIFSAEAQSKNLFQQNKLLNTRVLPKVEAQTYRAKTHCSHTE